MVSNFVITLPARASKEALHGCNRLSITENPVIAFVARRIVDYMWGLRAEGLIHLFHPQICRL
jgi:hypothetical protein